MEASQGHTPSGVNRSFGEEPESRLLWSSTAPEPTIAIREGSINVIANRIAEHNLKMSMRITMELAAEAERDVESWIDFDEQGNEVTIHDTPLVTEPTTIQDRPRIKRILYINSLASGEHFKATMNEYRDLLVQFRKRRERVGEGKDILSGLPIYVVQPWVGDIVEKHDTMRRLIEANGIDVVVLNSFEEATTTGYDKRKLVKQLKACQKELNITIIVFTTECRKGMMAGATSHGPIGALVGAAKTFWYVSDDRKEIRPYVDKRLMRESEDEFQTKHDYKKGQCKPEPPHDKEHSWERILWLLHKGEERTWEEEKELCPFSCAAMEERMTEEEKRKWGMKRR